MFAGGRNKSLEQRARLRELLMTDSKDPLTQIEPPQLQGNVNNKDRRVCNDMLLEWIWSKICSNVHLFDSSSLFFIKISIFQFCYCHQNLSIL